MQSITNLHLHQVCLEVPLVHENQLAPKKLIYLLRSQFSYHLNIYLLHFKVWFYKNRCRKRKISCLSTFSQFCGALSNHPGPRKPALYYKKIQDGFFRKKTQNIKNYSCCLLQISGFCFYFWIILLPQKKYSHYPLCKLHYQVWFYQSLTILRPVLGKWEWLFLI